jgi:Fe-S-cluster containining protein
MKYGCKECSNCGVCCKGWDIELSKEDIRNLINLGYTIHDFLDINPVPKMKLVGKEKNCIFLDKENMCILEKRHGHSAKPHTCKHYPNINSEKIKEKDYFFYRYKDKVFTRDLLIKMLEKVKKAEKHQLFETFLHELERLGKHEPYYIDIFNYDENKNPSGFGKIITRGKIDDIASIKFGKEEREMLSKIIKRKKLNTEKLIEEIKKRILTNDAINQNLPEMLLAFFYILRNEEPRDAKKLANFFFEWNSKRF